MEQTRTPGGKVALLGDMNCGPSTSLARAASPDAFARFGGAGFAAPYVEEDGRCTFCGNNPLNGFATDPEEGALIDHVLLSGFDEASAATGTRVLDGEITLSAGDGDVSGAHSDHYGVQVTVSWSTEP